MGSQRFGYDLVGAPRCERTRPRAAEEPPLMHGAGICKWSNVRLGLGFLSMTAGAGSKLHMEGFRSLKEGEAVEFTLKKSKGRCYNCRGLDHHAKECKLPPQPKKCHFCQSINHMVASCPLKAQQAPSSQEKPPTFGRRKKRSIALPCSQRLRIEPQWVGAILL
ncbi:hypothetical protein FD755_010147 [Muntiacus reevesi]|uniref:Protein lin-28 homolog A n=1 Tax=Muntiacus reevesi TaxID=9886 RepID=A0A5N3XXC5_MUNRE|nr:hypothetical protein FD755_010147 [Muntiacus reevesi]